MKRIALLLLTAFYFQSTLGIAINRNCCNNKRQEAIHYDASLYYKSTKQVKSCCKTTRQDFKAKDMYTYTRAFSLDTKQFPTFQVLHLAVQVDKNTDAQGLFNKNINGPPKHGELRVYALNCNYRI